jgi:hypothetical protein
MHEIQRYEIGLKINESSGYALFTPVVWSGGGGGGNLTNMKGRIK